MGNRSNSIGKWLEGKVQTAMREIQAEHHAVYYRFPDTHSARNFLPSQPGDHLFAIDGRVYLIEEKCSEKHRLLESGFSSLWGKKQAAFHRIWNRAGIKSLIIFAYKPEGLVYIWDSAPLAKLRSEGKRIPGDMSPLAFGKVTDLGGLLLEACKG